MVDLYEKSKEKHKFVLSVFLNLSQTSFVKR